MNEIQELIDQANKFLGIRVHSIAGAIRRLEFEYEDIESNESVFDLYTELCDVMAGYDFEEYKRIMGEC